jgi:hypothetical protein
MQLEGALSVIRGVPFLWSKVGNVGNTFALGAASYLGWREATSLARIVNPQMKELFPGLHERLCEVLGGLLESECTFEEGLGLPGFQIQIATAPGMEPAGCTGLPHWDWQLFTTRERPLELPDVVSPLDFVSYTCLLEAPHCGAFLDVWPDEWSFGSCPKDNVTLGSMAARIAEVDATSRRHRQLEVSRSSPFTIPYALGELIIHTGHRFHRPTPWISRHEGEARVTLQGHGLKRDKGWRLYW